MRAGPRQTAGTWGRRRVDPSAGDDEEGTRLPPERLLTGELRARSGDVVTLAVDAVDAALLDAATSYRLVSLPAEPQADREFASLLRAADETMAAVAVTDASAVVGDTLGSLDVTVAAVRTASGSVEAIPPRSRTIDAGDTLYVVARPEVLRRLEARASVVVEVPPSAESAVGATTN